MTDERKYAILFAATIVCARKLEMDQAASADQSLLLNFGECGQVTNLDRRLNQLKSVYHGEKGLRTLREMARTYPAITRDLTRVMTRVKAIYRSWGIPCAGRQVYTLPTPEGMVGETRGRRRASSSGFYYQ
jgi:hypothetical protein